MQVLMSGAVYKQPRGSVGSIILNELLKSAKAGVIAAFVLLSMVLPTRLWDDSKNSEGPRHD